MKKSALRMFLKNAGLYFLSPLQIYFPLGIILKNFSGPYLDTSRSVVWQNIL